MQANRRRQRTPDPLATPDAVRAVIDQLRERLPEIISTGEKLTVAMLNAVRNIERRPATDTKRGRPSRWERKDLLRVASQLRSILNRETKGRVSLNSFVGLYLRILNFPKDVTRALVAGDVTLFEAAQLARLNGDRLGISPPEARECRARMLKAHLLAHGSQSGLQARINEQLGVKNLPNQMMGGTIGTALVDELLELNPYDPRHLFWEELRRIAFALREVTPEDIDDKTLKQFLAASDQLSRMLARIQKRRRQREKPGRSNLKR